MSKTKWINDGGHGGTDSGAIHNGVKEKDYTLEASLYVNNRMREHGISTTTTRNKDVSLQNNQRTGIVKLYDKCISHHFNAGGGNGVEVIHSIHSNGGFEKLVIDEFKKAGYPIRNKPIYTRKLNNVNRDYYFMHRETGSCRTTIIEYDFLDGKNHDKLKDKKYREGMYECVIRAVCKEEGITYKPISEKVVEDKPVKNESGKTYYRVVVASYLDKKNANDMVLELNKKGYSPFIAIYRE